MSQPEEVVSPISVSKERDDSSSDNMEDAVEKQDIHGDVPETASARSLTKRSPSTNQRPPHDSQAKSTTQEESAPVTANAGSTPDRTNESPAPEHESALEKRRDSIQSSRLSDTSNLDIVNLDDDLGAPQKQENTAKSHIPKEASKTLSLSSITNALPSMPWSPSADSTSKSPIPSPPAPSSSSASHISPPAPPTRKLTSPFSWLSRNSTHKDGNTSPPSSQPSPRRNTVSSIATLTSNPEMMLGRLDEESSPGSSGAGNGNSLKDRFKQVRMREEAGITIPAGDDVPPTPVAPSAASIASNDSGEGSKSLAPGTASGVSAGPSAIAEAEVDWDLWQNVVYEGPAAVARSSADELNRAIATGIPSAIRGVVWQVLAQSKNEELERVYKELVARGTDKQKDRNSSGTSVSASTNGSLGVQSDPVASSGSSTHSDHSGINNVASPRTPNEKPLSEAEKKKKEKEDMAMLQKLEKVIRRDMGARTSYSKYAAAAGLQEGLFGVCKAYALYDEGVGYAQGMNFLVMPILFNMPEEEAFTLLVRLMNHYNLRDLFIQDMPGLHLRLYQFERLLEDLEPALYCHLRRRNISPHLYATQWFLTLFAYRFPLQLVLRIYDLILSEGLSAILRFGIILMRKNAAALLAISDMQQLTTFLKDRLFDVYIDKDPSAGSILENGFFGSSSSNLDKEVYRADQLVRDACEVKLTPELLKSYTVEWEEKTKAEKDRETELETLRTTSASLAIKLRKLEERLEAADAEQATMATELVHTKVENEELKDENESLKGQVKELRIVIEKQPEEIEQAWKLERDDLMKRNQKVHDENQRLEQELATLEEQLVQTKMQYAEVIISSYAVTHIVPHNSLTNAIMQINSQHEALNRRWTDLKRQFA
ncbi:hypothetical protein jhhlp_001078 [Lomentospora prolificans]|uniref:GTPase-activating protein GYP5 n=1 Tax=Lomentospora prolificans TaxID=41688 RepID=A0A2N3NH74_9PEZI|nr:hypothetical protein jhhlp_001078 [Lomentospora prolificans]